MSLVIRRNTSAEFDSFIAKLNWSVGRTKSRQSFYAALRAASLGIERTEAFERIKAAIDNAGGRFVRHKVERDLDRAGIMADKDRHEFNNSGGGGLPEFDPDTLRKTVAHLGGLNIEAMLARRSIRPPELISTGEFLGTIFRPREIVRVFQGTTEGQGQPVTIGSVTARLPAGGREGAWFLSFPVDGQQKLNDEGRPSFRSHQNGTRFPYLILETDEAPEDQWLALLASLEGCVVAITHSGKRGAHGLLHVGCNTWGEVQEAATKLKTQLVRLGACSGALRAGLTRLPGVLRNGREQKLLYLRPREHTDNRPILELEPTVAQWKRVATAILEDKQRGAEEFAGELAAQAIQALSEWGEEQLAADLRAAADGPHIERIASQYQRNES